jgi:predicted 3-demethylubiquinone-9 3-methyltransferase (glyoxalase superfamily)
MQKITPFLWFDGNAEEAMNFYVTIFKNSKIVSLSRAGEGAHVTGGTFQLDGQELYALNGGPHYKFTPAISLHINCETQEEIDELWEKLSAGGSHLQCGWLTDKFGLTWQVIPSVLGKLLTDRAGGNTKKVFEAMMKMQKLDIVTLEQAYRSE